MKEIWAVTNQPDILQHPVQIWRPEEAVAEMVDDIQKHYPNSGWVYFFADEGTML